MIKILVIDDDCQMLELICDALEQSGYYVEGESNPLLVDSKRCQQYDLLLLDVMMPVEDGFSLCTRIRDSVDCPILFLTAKTEETALIKGFGLGADDYIKKPFSIGELRARVNAHLRREDRQPNHAMTRGGVRFNMHAKEAVVGETAILLTKSEYAISEYLALHAGQVFTKDQLYEAIFGYDAEGEPSAIAEHIKNIRGKLKTVGLNPIETVWGVGYKWQKENAR
ncbi:response regulator transcription factor [Fusibacter paucivorans]|uniref:Stage 0 sporulation protein A homolog n=1 Tax=Fusibacter paucivorans TaxID=76009 RepID=A0ABS5PP55_9FIRM|nr:response regulator transcription factor [Fusibacter paucivorans]